MKNFLVILLLGIATLAFAETGKVVTVKGNAQVQKDGSGSFTKISKGYIIKKNDMIKLDKGSKITFKCASGSPVEYRKPGSLSGAKLFANSKKKGSASKKFGKFMMDELSETDDLLESGNHKKRMGTLGAVERALPTGKDNKFDVVFPKNSFLIEPTVDLVWNTVPEAKAYTLKITDNEGFEINEYSVTDNNFQLNLSEISPQKGICYFWSVESDNGKVTDNYCLLIAEDEIISQINTTFEEVDEEFSVDNPINAYLKAKVYEENNMYIAADSSYKQAIDLSDKDERFVMIYNNYLDRTTQ